MSEIKVGLTGWGTYIPKKVMTSQDLAEKTGLPADIIREKLGIKQKPVPGPSDHCSLMAIKAAHKAINKAGIQPEDIDLVIWTGDEYKDFPLWTAGIKVKEEIGAKNAWAFDVALRCGTFILALKVGQSMIQSDPEIKTVLLAGGYRNGDLINYENPRVRFMYNLGAGASAAVLQENAENNILLGAAFVDDGTLSEMVAIPAGGTREPLTPESVIEGRHQLDVLDPEGMQERLEEVSMKNFFWAVDTALARSGLERNHIHYLALLHMKRSAHEGILKALGLQEEQSVYLEDYGHLGQNDQILSLELALKKELLKEGSIVVMVSAGIGYAWNAQVIRWGKEGIE